MTTDRTSPPERDRATSSEKKWPHGRRLADFADLSATETELVEACRRGKAAVFAEQLPPRRARKPVIRAELIRFLVLGGDDEAPVHEHGVEIKGAIIHGRLDLNDAKVVRPMRLLCCRVAEVAGRTASLHGIDLSGSTVTGGIDLTGARCSGSIYFGDGFVSRGTIRLRGAELSGDLDCGKARIEGSKGIAISADGMAVAGSIFLNKGFAATGEVGFVDSDVEGSFECSGGRFENRSGDALTLDRAVIGGTLFLDEGFRAAGCVRIYGSRLGSNLRLSGARLKSRGMALVCNGAAIRGSVTIRDGFRAAGEVSLVGVGIGGTLECERARLRNGKGCALALDRTTVTGSAYLGPDFCAVGTVSLNGATIGSNLNCTGGRFRRCGGQALTASGCTVSGSIFMRKGFAASGEVALVGSRIGGTLECDGGVFDNNGGNALTLDRLRVSGSTFFNALSADGRVSLAGALIESNLLCTGATIANAGGAALDCSGAAVTGQFHLRRMNDVTGEINLSGMHVGTLCDDESLAALLGVLLVLDGLVYARLGQDAPCSADSRDAWLARQRPEHVSSSFRPQPWEAMISTLQAMGHPGEARQLAVLKHKRMRSARRYVGGSWLWDSVYGSLVGYGYRPWRLVSVMGAVWLACTLAYWPAANPRLFGFETHLIAPRQPGGQAGSAPATRQRYEDLFLPAYSAEVMLPIANLGYEAEWRPIVRSAEGRGLPWGWLIASIYWFEIVFGWLASLMLVAAVGNLIKKD